MPPLRILIAEKQHSQRLLIEKSLNLLGEFGVAPVASFQELDELTQTGLIVDLVIVNSTLTQEQGIDAALFCLRNPSVRNALIYGDDHLLLRDGATTKQWGTLMMARFADLPALTRVLLNLAP